MNRWFEARLEGNYVGEPSTGEARRQRLRVYQAALRELRWIEAPPAAAEGPVLRQERIERAHVAGVRGAGSWYEGPLFEVVIRGPKFSHPLEKDGRSYGRVVGEAVGWLALPPEPETPVVEVREQAAPEAPLMAAVYREPKQAPDRDLLEPEPEPEPEIRSTTQPRAASHLLPLSAFTAAVGLALFVTGGGAPLGLWTLFMLPTLLARRLFLGVLRDGGFLRGFGYASIALQVFCVSQLVSSAWASGCPKLALLPMLGVIALLFPAGILPSILPLCCNALGLALVLATFASPPTGDCRAATPAVEQQ
ncbi:MAG TPA: hypothetical protein VJR89_23650 [Polyangiales bacterium]|nr:hypothetical protein [Polyangiales bacterium]